MVKGNGPTLLGRNWLGTIKINWYDIHYTPSTGLQNLLERYNVVFQDKLGCFQGRQAKIEVDPDAVPRYCKARMLPYSMRAKVETGGRRHPGTCRVFRLGSTCGGSTEE